jgi:hypothetical protein
MKICPVGAELFHADGQTDGQTDRNVAANIAFCSFANAAKNLYFDRNIYGYCKAK